MAKNLFSNLALIAQNTQSDNIKMIDIAELHESADNFFAMENIAAFADTILGQGGVKDNLLVKPLEGGGYEIISGHRRRAAVQYLLDNGESISRFLPCLVQEYADEDSKMLDLILMNVSARQLSDSELLRCYETLTDLFQRRKDNGERFGRMRETIAEMLNISPAQVGKLQNVEKNAIDEIKEAVHSGELSISTANVIARLDAAEQQKIAQQDVTRVKPKELKKSKPKKVDTSINFSEEASDFDMDNADTDTSKVDTSINFDEVENLIIQLCHLYSQNTKKSYKGAEKIAKQLEKQGILRNAELFMDKWK